MSPNLPHGNPRACCYLPRFFNPSTKFPSNPDALDVVPRCLYPPARRVVSNASCTTNGLAPVATVSMCDFVAELGKSATAQEVNAASLNGLRGVLDHSDEPCVSVDFCGSYASSLADAPCAVSLGGNLVKIFAWYDNEWGYCCRLTKLAKLIVGKDL